MCTGTNSLLLCNFLVIISDIQYLFFFFYEKLFSQQFQLVRVWKFCSTGRNHFWVLLVVEEEFRWIPEMSSYIRCCCASNQFEFRIWALDHEQRKKIKTVLQSVDYLSATSDVRTRSNTSFMTVTIHQIQIHLKKCRTCEHILGRRTKSAVATKLHGIFQKYDIFGEVSFISNESLLRMPNLQMFTAYMITATNNNLCMIWKKTEVRFRLCL